MDHPQADRVARRTSAGGRTEPGRSAQRDRCANCGAVVALADWHPVAAPPDGDGVSPFCRAACRTAWLAAHEGTGDSP